MLRNQFGDEERKFVGASAKYLLLIPSNMHYVRSSNMQYICIKIHTRNEKVYGIYI